MRGRAARFHPTGGRAVVRPEHDQRRRLGRGEPAKTGARGRVYDHVARNLGIVEPRRALGKAPLGVVLGDLLALRVVLVRVTDVGERQQRRSGGEHPSERQRVVIVRGSVVGHDRANGHGAMLGDGGGPGIGPLDNDRQRAAIQTAAI